MKEMSLCPATHQHTTKGSTLNDTYNSASAPTVKAGRSQRPIWLGADKRQWDHVRVHIQLLNDTRIDAYGLAIYMGLVAHAELNSGECFPGLERLASYANMHRATAKKAVESLRTAGYVEFVDNDGNAFIPDSKKRTGKSYRYRVLPPPYLAAEFDLSTRRDETDTSDFHRSRSGLSGVRDFSDLGSRRDRDEQEPKNKNQRTRGLSFPQPCGFCDEGWIFDSNGVASRCPCQRQAS